jgi:hypothetical protein
MQSDMQTESSDTHDHILFVYTTAEERLRVLAEYFGEGLDNNDQCVFVTPEASEKAVADFLTAGLDVTEALEQKQMYIFEMKATYLPHGRFVADYMLTNVINFIMDARDKGYSGIRTAGEMSWLHENPEFLADATLYEHQINGVNAMNPDFTGLCLHPAHEVPGKILDSALQTHPSFIYDGTLRPNPHYIAKLV